MIRVKLILHTSILKKMTEEQFFMNYLHDVKIK